MELTLSEDEISLVTQVLKNHLPALREEIYKTENFDWRMSLKRDEELLECVVARLESAAHPSHVA